MSLATLTTPTCPHPHPCGPRTAVPVLQYITERPPETADPCSVQKVRLGDTEAVRSAAAMLADAQVEVPAHVVYVQHAIGAGCGILSVLGGASLWLVATLNRAEGVAGPTHRLWCDALMAISVDAVVVILVPLADCSYRCHHRPPVLHILACLGAFDCMTGASFMLAAAYLLPTSLKERWCAPPRGSSSYRATSRCTILRRWSWDCDASLFLWLVGTLGSTWWTCTLAWY